MGTPVDQLSDSSPLRSELRPKLLSLTAAAEELSISRRTICRLIESGRLKTVLVGRRRLVKATEIDRFIDDLEDAS